jgi:NTE family protein
MPSRTKKRIGLALGSGAARGLAHIGVLSALAEAGVGVDLVTGTSIGAFIGALHAAGVPASRMAEVARNVDWRQLARLLDPTLPTSGLIDGKKVARFMAGLLPVRTFEELAIPLAVVATDVETGESLVIRQGELLPALQAAVTFPGIFTPVRFGERYLVDGGLRNPVPADVARELGAEAVIGVCAIPAVDKRLTEISLPAAGAEAKGRTNFLRDIFNSARVEGLIQSLWGPAVHEEHPVEEGASRKPPGIFRICAQSVAIMENEINELRLARNDIDVLIRPDLSGLTLLEFHRADEAIRAGEAATRPLLRKIRALAGH